MPDATDGEFASHPCAPRRSLGGKVPGLDAFLARAPTPIVRERGDAAASAGEDRTIVNEFAGLRRAANRELVEERVGGGTLDTGATVPAGVLEEMKDYYRARAGEYDEWFERRGRFDQGREANGRWFADAADAFAALDALAMTGDLLELAPGTGIWTERLLTTATSVTAVDASPEMIEINRARVDDERVDYVVADLFAWQPDRQYDGVCFGFWLSHVPAERLDPFFQMIAAALKPGGKLFFVDNGHRDQTSTAADQPLPTPETQVMTRRLNDGRTFQVVKNFYEPHLLTAVCAKVGLDVTVHQTPTYFLYGAGTRQG